MWTLDLWGTEGNHVVSIIAISPDSIVISDLGPGGVDWPGASVNPPNIRESLDTKF